MSNAAEVVFTGSAKELLAEYHKVQAKNQQLEQDLQNVGKASKDANRDATKAFNETRTAAEKHATTIARLNELLKSGHIAQETYVRAVAKANEKLQKSGEHVSFMDGAFGKAAASAGTLLARVGSIDAAVNAAKVGVAELRKEFEDLERLREEARASQQTYGDVLRETLTNFSADATMKDEDVDPAVREVAKKTGAEVAAVMRAAGAGFSAQGMLTNAQTMEAVEEAFRLMPADPEAANSLAAGAMKMANQAGTTDFKSIMGFLTQAKQGTSIKGDKQFSQSFIPAVNAAVTRGGTHEEAGEVFATLGDLMGDDMGDRTRTAMIQMNEQLATALPDLVGIAARVRFMQQNPEEAMEFMANANFEAAAEPFVEKLLTGTPDAKALLAAKQKTIGAIDAPGNAAEWESRIENLNNQSFQKQIAAGRRAEANLVDFELGEEALGVAGESTKIRQSTLKKMDTFGANWINRTTAEHTERVAGAFADGPTASKVGLEFGTRIGERAQEAAMEGALRQLIGPGAAFAREAAGFVLKAVDPEAARRAERQEKLMADQLKVLKELRDQTRRPIGGAGASPAAQLSRNH